MYVYLLSVIHLVPVEFRLNYLFNKYYDVHTYVHMYNGCYTMSLRNTSRSCSYQNSIETHDVGRIEIT